MLPHVLNQASPSNSEELLPPYYQHLWETPGMGLGGVVPLVGSKGKAPKAPTVLRYLKPENTQFWIIYTWPVTQNKQSTTSEDTMKDCQPEEKFCCLKNKLTYPNKNTKIIFIYFSFFKNEEICSFSFKYDVQYILCQ